MCHSSIPEFLAGVAFDHCWRLLLGWGKRGWVTCLASACFKNCSHPIMVVSSIYLYCKSGQISWHWSNALPFVIVGAAGGADKSFCAGGRTMVKSLVAVWLKFRIFCYFACWPGFVPINASKFTHHYRICRRVELERGKTNADFICLQLWEEYPFLAITQSKFNFTAGRLCWCYVWIAAVVTFLIDGLRVPHPRRGRCVSGVRYWLLQAHFALAFISLFFIFGHLYLCTTGRTPHETFKSMVDGYHRH